MLHMLSYDSSEQSDNVFVSGQFFDCLQYFDSLSARMMLWGIVRFIKEVSIYVMLHICFKLHM
jgi:hypothetical protein